MTFSTLTLVIISACTSLFILSFGLYSLCISKNKVFPGSEKPEKMASMILESIYLMAKSLIGVFIVTAILLLMSEKIISNEQGLPIVTLIVGYIVGKEFTISKNSNDSLE